MTAPATGNKRERALNLYLVFSCIALLVVIYLFSAGRDRHAVRQLEKQISQATEQAAMQKAVLPILEKLREENHDTGTGEDVDGGIEPRTDSTADNYQPVIEELVRQCDLDLIAMTPDLASILSEEGHLLVDLEVRGEFSNLRRLILQVVRLPYLLGVDRFRVAQTSDNNGLGMLLQLRLQITPETESAHEDQ